MWKRRDTFGRRHNIAVWAICLLSSGVACAPRPADLYHSAQVFYRQGLFADASKNAEKGYAFYQNNPKSEWYWKFALLAAELQLERGNTSRADRFLTAPPPPEFSGLLARYEMLRGYALYRRKRFQDALALLSHAVRAAQSLADYETEADVWLLSGTVHTGDGDLPAADSDFQQAQQLAEAHHLDYQRAAALMNRGVIQLNRERYADAIPLLDASRETADRAGAKSLSLSALENVATCYESLGNLSQALASLQASVSEQKRSGLATYLSDDYSELGIIHLRMGQVNEAIRYFREAIEAVGKDAPLEYSSAAGNLARVLQETGSLDEAEHFNQLALQFAAPKDKAANASLISTQAAIAERRGQYDSALAAYQKALTLGSAAPSVLWQAYAGLAAVYAAKGDFPNADVNYSHALAVISSNRADQLKSDYKITFLSDLIRFYQDYVSLLMQHGDTDRALEIADSSRASVLTEELIGQNVPTRTGIVPQLQKAARASHSVFLFYWLAPKNSYVWVINSRGVKAMPLADQTQISQDVASYRALIEDQKRDPVAIASPSGVRLYQELIAPVADSIPPGSHVVVVPDGVLHNLNFETLLVLLPKLHYWIEDATIAIAPSLSILRVGKATFFNHRSLLMMGDPIPPPGYQPLPEAALEISSIRHLFPASDSTVVTGANAVVDAYAAAQPQRFSNIHFATHVDANAESPLDSAIILSPQAGRFSLYARDVARNPLNADLVTISACRGAGARTLSGEGLVGFAWAFFQAHAQNVVTSLWEVEDNSTAQLMGDFYAGVNARHSYASALRDAKLKLLHSRNARPYYWAPFQLYSRSLLN